MKITPTRLRDVLVVEPAVYCDDRGFFAETWNRRRFDAAVGQDVRFDDQAFGIEWPRLGIEPLLSPKDSAAPPMRDLAWPAAPTEALEHAA